MRIKLSKENIDKCFEVDHQSKAAVNLYKIAFPDWDKIVKINGYPTISKNTNIYIFEKFKEFDKKNYPNVMAGGLWMNNGFSQLESEKLSLNDFEIETSTAEVEYN